LDAKGSRMGFFLIKLLMNIPSMKPCLSCALTKNSLLRNKECEELEVGLKNHQYPHAGINTPVFSNHAPHTFQDFKAGRCDGLTSYLTLCCTMPTCYESDHCIVFLPTHPKLLWFLPLMGLFQD
jgi:hypothetical protein